MTEDMKTVADLARENERLKLQLEQPKPTTWDEVLKFTAQGIVVLLVGWGLLSLAGHALRDVSAKRACVASLQAMEKAA